MAEAQEGAQATEAPPAEGEARVPSALAGEATSEPTEAQPADEAGDGMPSVLDDLESDAKPSEGEGDEQGEGGDSEDQDDDGEVKLELPEGSKLGEDHLKVVEGFAKEHGFSQKQAEALLAWHNQLASADADNWSRHQREQATNWAKELRADPQFGGEAYKENLGFYNRGLEAVFPLEEYPEFRAMLKRTGYINNPDFAKPIAAFARKFLSERNAPLKGETTPELTEEERIRRAYPNSYDDMKRSLKTA